MSEYVKNLVLIPGLNNTKQIWDEVIEHLPSSIECYPITVPAIANLDQLAEEVLKGLPDQFHLAGFSFGGFLALAMLEKAPERITGLSLIGTSAEGESDASRELRKKSIARAKSGEYEEMVAAGVNRTFYPSNVEDKKFQKIRKQMLTDYGQDRYIAHATATMARVDRHHLLEKHDIPYLFVASVNDVVVPLEKTKQMTNYAKNAQFATVDRSGHLIPLEQPKELAELMEPWLEK
ncbi:MULTISPECIES: alpha/beta fold hydrolase [Neobacillus]|uniref:Alpha/beta hydrolase n=1 Tax=Neobacillus citreus TaxID=2833578 RepID=A0A942T5S0_9BACI|nr:alpha/beta hydrolase [Neobacillus citreus]MCH6264240.1 alpha/beta hydrolase [Neobacillus citreus]